MDYIFRTYGTVGFFKRLVLRLLGFKVIADHRGVRRGTFVFNFNDDGSIDYALKDILK